MKLVYVVGRPLILAALLFAGISLIRHVGLNLSPAGPQAGIGMNESELRPSEAQEILPPAIEEAPASEESFGSEELPRIELTGRGRQIITEPILFNSGAATLRETSIPALDKIAVLLGRFPDLKIEIVGHTDNFGPEDANQSVSADRAAIVREYLISRGIQPSRLSSRGMGSADPVESNDTLLGRQANRRIEFLILADPAAQ